MKELLFHLQDDLNKKNVELWESLITNPTILNRTPFIDEFCLHYLPDDCGIEIETELLESSNLINTRSIFENIPFIKNVRISNSESSFRIPNGIDGFVCLYHIFDTIKETHYNSVNSTHHYHIDMTDWFDNVLFDQMTGINEESILTELDIWNYQYGKNKRRVVLDAKYNWVNFRSVFKTCEFRCGDSTFDYQTVILRLIHSSRIITDLKGNYLNNNVVKKLEKELNKLKTNSSTSKLLESDMEQIIKSRLC